MSQINDALKKASRSHREPVNPPPSAVPAPTAAEPVPAPAPAPASSNRGFPIGAMAVLAVALLLLGWFVRDWWEDNRPQRDESEPMAFGGGGEAATAWRPAQPAVIRVAPTAKEPPGPPAGDPPTQVLVPERVPTPVQATAAQVTPSVATSPVSPVVPATPVFPTLRLQGIVFRLKDPSVLINGKTLYVGDEIQGVRVVKIERLSATVSFGGETRALVMR